MRDFQNDSLELAELILAGGNAGARYRFLIQAFRRTFLHYTRKTPGHWTDPAGTWHGFPDLPHIGSCVCLAFMTGKVCGLPCEETDELVMMYHQFLGAMSPSFTPEDTFYAYLSAVTASVLYPQEGHYAVLAASWRDKANSYIPSCERAVKIAEKIQQLLMKN